jgi:hypothetical protein
MPATVLPTPPTAPVGGVRADRAGADAAGNFWLLGNSGWEYIATWTGALPQSASAAAAASKPIPQEEDEDEERHTHTGRRRR